LRPARRVRAMQAHKWDCKAARRMRYDEYRHGRERAP
jgi:hypothetical protein